MKAPFRFYVVGGTLRADAPCYVERPADQELLDCLTRGEFCYVLTSRQMGKSSLMVRTATRLRSVGHRVVTLDLTALGQNLTVEQWYGGLLRLMGEQLGLEDELEEFWLTHRQLGPLQRWMSALRHVVLPVPAGTASEETPALILFVDEIDAVRGLDFSTDEFFAAIRECYNSQSADPLRERLRFCLIGVASPADLIQDSRSTPFNVGRRIVLEDFTPEQALPLAAGLERLNGSSLDRADGLPGAEARGLLRRVLHWTGGHPYLTQRLCEAVGESGGRARPEDVDRLCESLFLSPAARQRDDNLLFVRECLLRSDQRAGLLDLYERLLGWGAGLWRRGRIRDDETNELVSRLRLAGVVRGTSGYLKLRNRIYERVFNSAWVAQHKPDQEVRRQRAAFYRGMARAATAAAVVVSALTFTAASARQSETRARQLADDLRVALHEKDTLLSELRATNADLKRARNHSENQKQRAQASTVRAEWERDRADRARARWEVATREATAQREAAESQRGQANRARAESRQRLFNMMVGSGLRAAEEGDPGAALLWFTEGLGLARDRRQEQQQRVRIATTLSEAPRPLHLWKRQGAVAGRLIHGERRAVLWGPEEGVRVKDLDSGKDVFPPLRKPRGWGVSVSADQRRVAIVEDPHTLSVWDLETGRRVGEPLRYPHSVTSLALSPDGKRLACGSDSGHLSIRELVGRKEAQTRDAAPIAMLHFSADGRFLVTGTNRVQVRDAETGLPLGPPLQQCEDPLGIILSPDGEYVVVHIGAVAHVWGRRTGKRLWELPHEYVGGVLFSPDGSRVAAVAGSSVRVWELGDRRPAGPPLRASAQITGAAFSHDGSRLRTVSQDGWYSIWDAESGERLSTVRLGYTAVAAIFAEDEARVLTIGTGTVQLWRTSVGNAPARSWVDDDARGLPVLSPDGRLAVSGIRATQARVRWLNPPEHTLVLPHGSPIKALAITPDAKRVFTAGEDSRIRQWDARTGAPLGERPGKRPASGLSLSEDGKRLVVDYGFGQGEVVDLASGSTHAVGTGRPAPPSPEIMHSKDASVIVSSAAETELCVSQWKRGAYRSFRVSMGSKIAAAALSPDARLLAAGDENGDLCLWNLETGKPLGEPLKHAGGVIFLRFSEDGRLLLSAGRDCAARIWRAASREAVSPPFRYTEPWVHAAFSRSGRQVATVSVTGDAVVWEVPSGVALSRPMKHFAYTRVQFSADDRSLLGLTENGSVYRWEIPTERRPAADLRGLAERLAQRRVDRKSGVAPVADTDLLSAYRKLGGRPGDRVTPRPSFHWHQEQARRAEEHRHWAVAVVHLNRLVEAFPESRAYRHRRALALGELQRWEAAAQDFAGVLRMGESHYVTYYQHAITRLAAGDLGGYRAVCREMLERFERSEAPRAREMTAWACSLGPDAVADLQRPIGIMRELLAKEPHNHEYLETLAALLLRTGRYLEAANCQREAVRKRGAEGSPLEQMLTVVIRARRGQTERARQLLAAVEAESVPWLYRSGVRQPWDTAAEYHIRRDEARRTLSEHAP